MRELQEAHFWAVEKEGQKRSRNVLLRNGCFPTLLTSKPCGGGKHICHGSGKADHIRDSASVDPYCSTPRRLERSSQGFLEPGSLAKGKAAASTLRQGPAAFLRGPTTFTLKTHCCWCWYTLPLPLNRRN